MTLMVASEIFISCIMAYWKEAKQDKFIMGVVKLLLLLLGHILYALTERSGKAHG